MQFSYEALNIVFFLLPGLLVTVVIRLLVYRKDASIFETFVSALLWSLVVYTISALIGNDVAVQLSETKRGDTVYRGITFNPAAITSVVSVAIGLALVTSLTLNHDWLGKVLRLMRITSQSGRANIWLDVFSEYRTFVIVHLVDERRVFGWVLHYSNTGDDGYIYLHEPKWIDENNEYVTTGSHGIFFVRPNLIDFIEFLGIPAKDPTKQVSDNQSDEPPKSF
jgi:hypothetical protein